MRTGATLARYAAALALAAIPAAGPAQTVPMTDELIANYAHGIGKACIVTDWQFALATDYADATALSVRLSPTLDPVKANCIYNWLASRNVPMSGVVPASVAQAGARGETRPLAPADPNLPPPYDPRRPPDIPRPPAATIATVPW